MEPFDQHLTHLITRVQLSGLSDEDKAEIYTEINIGLHKLVWSVLVSHIPEEKLSELTTQSKLTIDQYSDLIELALKSPGMSKELNTEIMDSLSEIETLLTKNGVPQIPA